MSSPHIVLDTVLVVAVYAAIISWTFGYALRAYARHKRELSLQRIAEQAWPPNK